MKHLLADHGATQQLDRGSRVAAPSSGRLSNQSRHCTDNADRISAEMDNDTLKANADHFGAENCERHGEEEQANEENRDNNQIVNEHIPIMMP